MTPRPRSNGLEARSGTSATVAFRGLDRWNRAHPWSHNDLYGSVVMRVAHRVRRDGGTRALDVGCGTGSLVARLADVVDEVVGYEPDPASAAAARAATAALGNVQIIEQEFPVPPVPHLGEQTRRYDIVSMVAVLHHLPLEAGLRAARDAVAPGGRLIVVGVARETTGDLPLSLLSVVFNPMVGLFLHPRRARSTPPQMTAPTAAPTTTYPEVRAAMRLALPGVSIRRSLFWRYVATWTAPR